MHWMWEMCPYALKRQFAGKEKEPSIVLEVVADYRLWIWHFYFGSTGSNNDINFFDSSPLINKHALSQDVYDPFLYELAGQQFQQLYYLNAKEKHLAKKQEAARKDVEQTFGVLQKRFHILKKPSQICHEGMCDMHNVIVEDEWDVEGLEALPEEKNACHGNHEG
ncbi:F21J9.3 [Phytophthora palmivora]|uniref:F21J9.3 n=1 Tax=Phytophthora palmivora TaxID=4796 RepID=A0A2P4XGH5_9STRA|nr:F21J9.3 [Phytophthora palmivora]